jgi:hypothetical protein
LVNFESLFLGLVLGTQTVMVQVADPVERVELLLDGQSVAEIVGPPWRGQVDLGRDLLPHELVAVAYDANDSELDRATQWLNLPRQPAETHILLERDETGRAVSARVSWESLVDDRPSAIRAEFDGIPLEPGSDQVIGGLPCQLRHHRRCSLDSEGTAEPSEATGDICDRIQQGFRADCCTETGIVSQRLRVEHAQYGDVPRWKIIMI